MNLIVLGVWNIFGPGQWWFLWFGYARIVCKNLRTNDGLVLKKRNHGISFESEKLDYAIGRNSRHTAGPRSRHRGGCSKGHRSKNLFPGGFGQCSKEPRPLSLCSGHRNPKRSRETTFVSATCGRPSRSSYKERSTGFFSTKMERTWGRARPNTKEGDKYILEAATGVKHRRMREREPMKDCPLY